MEIERSLLAPKDPVSLGLSRLLKYLLIRARLIERHKDLKMQPNTTELLLKLERTDWFCNAGTLLDASSEVTPVRTWAEASAICASESSEAAYLEAKSELTVQLSVRHVEAYKQWNQKLKELNPLVAKLIREKMMTPAVQTVVPNDAGSTSSIR